MADKSKMKCPSCYGAGTMQHGSGQLYACAPCEGTGQVDRPEVSPFDYVIEYTIPAGGSVPVSVEILSFDCLLKWLVASTATPTDKVIVKDNNGRQWSNAPMQLQNFAGSALLPFPMQPNWLQAKNTSLTFTFSGTSGHTGELVLKGINLADVPEALSN